MDLNEIEKEWGSISRNTCICERSMLLTGCPTCYSFFMAWMLEIPQLCVVSRKNSLFIKVINLTGIN